MGRARNGQCPQQGLFALALLFPRTPQILDDGSDGTARPRDGVNYAELSVVILVYPDSTDLIGPMIKTRGSPTRASVATRESGLTHCRHFGLASGAKEALRVGSPARSGRTGRTVLDRRRA